MALELPDWLTDAFNLIGLPWPGIDEDQLRAWATSVRKFATDITNNSSQTNQTMRGLADSSQSSVITAVADQYETHHRLLTELHGPMNDFAAALDHAADAVVAQKLVVIGAATALATEFIATQVGAIFTLGADEAALPEELISTQQIIKFALKDLEAVVIGRLINWGAQVLSDLVNRSIVSLANDAWSLKMEAGGLKVAYANIRRTASQIRGHADEAEDIGSKAHNENTSRDLEDSSRGSSWSEVINALRQGLLDIADDLFKSLPGTIARVLRDIAGILEKFASKLKASDDDGDITTPDGSAKTHAPETHATPGTEPVPIGAGGKEPDSVGSREQIGALEAGNAQLVEDITRQRTVERVAAECGLESDEQLEALRDAYDVAHDYSGALIVKAARDMLPDLKADMEEHPGARVVFVGRDGRSLAAAVRALDGEFFEEHCSEIVLSRALVETAVQDLELRSGASFPQMQGFRGAAGKVDPADTVGAYEQLTDYLRDNGIDAGLPGSHATLVDSSYKGTVQELLSAIYPDTSLKGRYLFFAASPGDPHPGTKFGYALHLEGAAANNGLPVIELSEDPELTFSHQDAIGAIEETLHGPGGSPKRMSGGLPEQPPADSGLTGFNPQVVSSRYSDGAVRDGAMRVSLEAVADLAAQAADPSSKAGATLDQRADAFRDQLRAWVSGGTADPRLSEYLDSFVRRPDKRVAAQLADVISSAGIDPTQASQAWHSFGECGTLAEKEAFAARFARQFGGGTDSG